MQPPRRAYRILGLIAIVIAVTVSACTPTESDKPVSVGQLRVVGLAVEVSDDGVAILSAFIENPTGVDRAFTVRWPEGPRTVERSALVTARTTLELTDVDGFVLTGLVVGSDETVTLTIVQGFFSRENEGALEVSVPVRR